MRDPQSVQFRNVRVLKETKKPGSKAVCGELNAKNGYGAYVGFKRFMVGGPVDTTTKGFTSDVAKVIETEPMTLTDTKTTKLRGVDLMTQLLKELEEAKLKDQENAMLAMCDTLK
ncbi:hypothetical protein IMZ29_08270 [Achromobacter sp. GG226]|uniref:hypothetical protein n=1 Tax=Verticiella alkaliphila TaxID=2779529 RepID=UPI001C0C75F8|nr:hypothetical protein [Verticiella sp. GG226]MBU4610533.1 hypothetical protein [Verticiella sp. GG226]